VENSAKGEPMEIFNQKRMERCQTIYSEIMENWQKTNFFTYTVKATDSVQGIMLDELRKRYFAVGLGDNLVEIPFADSWSFFR